MILRIVDAHQHFWNPDEGEYGWLCGPYAPIRRVFGPDDLRPELARAGVSATVLVQTWSSVAETRRFLALSETEDFIAGVVGWVDLTAPDVAATLSELKSGPGGDRLVGIRHQVHDEADENWLLRPDVVRSLTAVAEAGLVYDLLLRPRELPAALAIARRLPALKFVIDHLAKPDIRGSGFPIWAERLAPFTDERHHVWCKLSGMATEADWEHWQPADLQPYIDEALRIFGAERCLFGSDWPVCRLAGGYAKVLGALKTCIAGLPQGEQEYILSRSAEEAYGLATRAST
jgi:L-fuconolactonase